MGVGELLPPPPTTKKKKKIGFRRLLGTACAVQTCFQQLLLLPDTGVGFATSRGDEHTPTFPWVRLAGSINELWEVGLMYSVARTSSWGSVTLSQKYCLARDTFI